MIVVSVDLIKSTTGEKVPLGKMVIYNDGTGNKRTGNYEVRLRRKDSLELEPGWSEEGNARTGRVEKYPRLSYSVWRLVIRALRAVLPEYPAG